MFTTRDAADELRISQREARQLVSEGVLCSVGQFAGTHVLDELSVEAVARSRGRGRRWSAHVLRSALALLDGRDDSIELAASERSRLRSRLRRSTPGDIAYRAALRAARRRCRAQRRDDLRSALSLAGASTLTDGRIAREFGLTASDSWMLSGYTANPAELEREFGLVDDAVGNVAVLIDRTGLPYDSMALRALDLYTWGDSRESAAGARWLEGRMAEL